jgi:hypothetical protein
MNWDSKSTISSSFLDVATDGLPFSDGLGDLLSSEEIGDGGVFEATVLANTAVNFASIETLLGSLLAFMGASSGNSRGNKGCVTKRLMSHLPRLYDRKCL